MEINTSEGKLTVERREDGLVDLSIDTRNECAQAHLLGLNRIMNLLLARGMNEAVIIDQLIDIGGDQGIWADGQFVKSIPDAVAKALSEAD